MSFAKPFATPQPISQNKAKPVPNAFHSTGFIKRSNASHAPLHRTIPNTPLKHKRLKVGLDDIRLVYSPTLYPQILDKDYFIHGPSVAISNTTAYSDYFEDTFVIMQVIGSGEFAQVYKVKSKLDGFIYAVKKSKTAFNGAKDREIKLHEVQVAWDVGNLVNCVQLISMIPS